MKTLTIKNISAKKFWLKLTENEKFAYMTSSRSRAGWKRLIAFNPIDIYSFKMGNDRQNIYNFKNKNEGNLIVGYVGFDYGYELYNIIQHVKDDLDLPDIYFLSYNNYMEFKGKNAVVHYNEKNYVTKIENIYKRNIPGKNKFRISDFNTKISYEEYKQNFQRTKFDELNIFDMFPVAKGKLVINVQAFDAAGENFVAAVVPAEHKKIPKGTKRFEVVSKLRREIIDCDGFIFLVDSEMASAKFVHELLEERPNALLPHQLLLHFSNFLKHESGISIGQIQKPIAFALTKADCQADSEGCSLDYFKQMKINAANADMDNIQSSICSEDGQREAEKFIQIYFRELYNVSKDFSTKSFHAISCWGQEPEYYFNPDPQNPNEKHPIRRDEIHAYKKQGKDIKTWVKHIQPVCIEDPLVAILNEIENRAVRQKKRKIKLMLATVAASLVFFIIYPFRTP